jgi:hypothetical protein
VRETEYVQYLATPTMDVWRFISDLRNDCTWRHEVTGCELISGEAGGAPSSYRETVSWEGLEVTIVLTVSEAVNSSRVVVTGEDESYGTVAAWTLEPQDEGTLVTLRFSMETKGAAKLVEPFMWGIITRWLDRDLPRLGDHI